ncbi:Nup93/Nic96-domain-containing protein [Limtongia smithiae]|uniref:Nup93/Nic96-domain-containing protein n=1 Tax=Limtongia smithiae TaxID=1125753 RepID=UPI0034CEA507
MPTLLSTPARPSLFANTVSALTTTPAAKDVAQQQQLPPAASLLDQLLESTKSLPRNSTGLGTIQLGINEISAQARELRERAGGGAGQVTGSSGDGDTKAHYLLAVARINAEDIAQDLDTVTLEPLFGTGGVPFVGAAAAADTDIESYLRFRREENIVASIEDSVRQTTEKFDALVSETIKLDWNYEKLLICENYGLVPHGTAQKLAAELGADGASMPKLPLTGEATPGRDGAGTPGGSVSERGMVSNNSGWKRQSLGRSVLGSKFGSIAFSDIMSTAAQQQTQQQTTTTTTTPPQQQQQSALALQDRRFRYAQAVHSLNDARMQGVSFPLIQHFAEVTRNNVGMDTRTQQLFDSWIILSGLIPSDTRQRQFAHVYCESATFESAVDAAESIAMKKIITTSSREYLEIQFFSLVEKEIAKYPQEAQLGGIPSVVNKIHAYLKLLFLKNGVWVKPTLQVVNNLPIWALIYYLLRSGHMEEAVAFTTQYEGFFQKIERSFPMYLKAYANSGDERKLPRELTERLHTEFNNHIRMFNTKTDDPYKYALYKLLGRCDLARKTFPDVLLVAEDWMWAQLMLVQEPSSVLSTEIFGTPSSEQYTLEDLRTKLVQLGARHFNPRGSSPMLYVQMLLLSGQYERAMHTLYQTQPVDATHFAIALAYYGLLNVSTEGASAADSQLLTLGLKNVPEIDFARLVGYYTRDFRATDPEIAFDYLALLCLNADLKVGDKGKKYREMCHEAMREMVLETAEFATLLGDIRADGMREKGVIERKMKLIEITNETEFLHTITEQAALQADQDGRTADAVLLYHLSEQYDVVVGIINKTLGETLAVSDLSLGEAGATGGSGGISMSLAGKEDPVELAQGVMAMYSNDGEILRKVSSRNRAACGMLLNIMSARRAYDEGQWEQCLSFVAAVNVLPLEQQPAGSDTGSIRRRAQQFGELDESVARNVPMMLLMTMECCVRITREMDASAYGDATRSKKIGELRTRAKNCMIYAGMIQYRMPREVYGRLTLLETTL